jgi:proteic killer suppression protein
VITAPLAFSILSFGSKDTEKIWNGERVAKLPINIQTKGRMKLRMLNNSQTINDLRIPPGNKLEQLIGDRHGQFSIRVNDQWRICFKWEDGIASFVEITDYH